LLILRFFDVFFGRDAAEVYWRFEMMVCLEKFSDYLVESERAPHTVAGYVRDVRQFSDWFESANQERLGGENLTPIDVRQYRAAMEGERLGAATINRRLAAIRSFGSMLAATGSVAENPAAAVRGVKKQRLAPKWLDKRAQYKFQREVESQVFSARTEAARRQALRDQAAVALMAQAGLRVSEVCDLEVGDLEISERRGMVEIRSGKGGKSRVVPLNRTARKALEAWLEMRDGEACSLFTSKQGAGVSTSGLGRRVAELGRRAGVAVTAHTLRHTFAKNLVDAGVSLEKVAALLGHSNLNTTKIYTIPGEADLQTAVDALDL
jgi:integrase/recombinase XerC